MDYHLEKEIRLNDKSKHERLYSWCLEETDSEGEKVGGELIPWHWSFNFTASEMRLTQRLKFGKFSLLDGAEEDSNREKEPNFEDSQIISATIHPGICIDGKSLEDNPGFSMFGTNRTIAEFTLRISKADDEVNERCSIWGGVSYTSENDFGNETTPDVIQIQVHLSEDRFSYLADLISNKTVDVVNVGISRVSGCYSPWSPSTSTNNVKILARGREQKIIKPDGCEIDPPRLGDVGEFELTLITRSKLDPKQNFNTLNISELFDDSEEVYEEEAENIEEHEDLSKLLLTQIAQNQAELLKIKKPIWLLAMLLAMLLLSTWL